MLVDKKQQLRASMQAYRAELTPQQKETYDAAIAQRVQDERIWKQSHTIFLYWSVRKEVQTHQLIHQALQSGKSVCLPKCHENGMMTAHRITCVEDLTQIRYGIAEPDATCLQVPATQINLIITPCLCVDSKGYRLGYGGGYYDRFLARVPKVATIALCYQQGIVPTTYPQAHDIPVQQVITERGRVYFNEK